VLDISMAKQPVDRCVPNSNAWAVNILSQHTDSYSEQLPACYVNVRCCTHRIVIQEDQSYGQRILSWQITTAPQGVQVAAGQSIGNKRIVVLKNGTTVGGPGGGSNATTHLVFEVLQAKAQPVIRALEAYYPCPTA
jgi:hypothetical protein